MALTPPAASSRYTCDFVLGSLPVSAKRLLEVGCGRGELAALLQSNGLEVAAIDSDREAVEAAKAAGADARLATWPSELDERFDAVLFTRSLHHIAPLEEAVAAARDALVPSGRIIVEDFRAEGGGAAGERWFTDLARSLIAEGSLTPETTLEELVEKLVPDNHDLHSSVAIAAELGGIGAVDASDAAYYFRYLEPHLNRPADAWQLLDSELEAIAAGSIVPLGKRFVVHFS